VWGISTGRSSSHKLYKTEINRPGIPPRQSTTKAASDWTVQTGFQAFIVDSGLSYGLVLPL